MVPQTNNGTTVSHPPVRTWTLPIKEVKTTGNKYITPNAKGNSAHNPLHKHLPKIATKCSQKKSPAQTRQQTPNQPRYTTPPPSPIFLHGVINCNKMINSVNEVAEAEQFYTWSLANNVIKITCLTPETYRSLIKQFKDTGDYYHTYQIKEERACRFVLKYLHHSTEIEDIGQDLLQQGHVARNTVNVRHRTTKEPLNYFFLTSNRLRTTKKYTT